MTPLGPRPTRPRGVGHLWVFVLVGGILLLGAWSGGSSGPRSTVRNAGALIVVPWVGLPSAPDLTLVPAPSVATAPAWVNVTATASGGVPPYNLTVCFGTADHTSPSPNCGVGRTAWDGSPIRFAEFYPTAGNYSVVAIASDSHGAQVGTTALVVVTNGATLVATAVELGSSGVAPFSVTFNDTVTGGLPPFTVQWSFGDGTQGSSIPGVALTHVYSTPGAYTPVLNVSDSGGHQTSKTLPTVTVQGAGTTGFLSGNNAPAFWAAFGVFLAGVGVAVLAVRFVQVRRWRREGDDLVERMRGRAEAPAETPQGP